MNIPLKYEDVVAKLALEQEMSASTLGELEDLVEKLNNALGENDALQQRLTAAEQRSSELESAAREMLRIAAIANQGSKAYNRAIINLHSALNPATEQVGLGSGKPVPPSKPVDPPIRRVVNDLVINKSEIEAHTTRNWRS